MPTYEYACHKCEVLHDLMLFISERDEPQKCPTCSATMERQVTVPNGVLAGEQTHTEENGGKGRYYGQLARLMPFGRPDPKAYFTNPERARDAAKKIADTTPGKHYERAS